MGFLDWLAKLLGGGPTESGGRSWGVLEPPPPEERRKKLKATAHHDAERLATNGLPDIATREALADFLGITTGALDWLTTDDDTPEPRHYIAFAVPKRSGESVETVKCSGYML